MLVGIFVLVYRIGLGVCGILITTLTTFSYVGLGIQGEELGLAFLAVDCMYLVISGCLCI